MEYVSEVIRPSKDLRSNYQEISKLCRENRVPVSVTVNGRADTVILNYEQYLEIQNEVKSLEACNKLYLKLMQGQDDVMTGRTRSAEEVFSELETKIKEWSSHE